MAQKGSNKDVVEPVLPEVGRDVSPRTREFLRQSVPQPVCAAVTRPRPTRVDEKECVVGYVGGAPNPGSSNQMSPFFLYLDVPLETCHPIPVLSFALDDRLFRKMCEGSRTVRVYVWVWVHVSVCVCTWMNTRVSGHVCTSVWVYVSVCV